MELVADAPIKFLADYQIAWCDHIKPLRRRRFLISTADILSIHGDAPKDFVRIREEAPGAVAISRKRRRVSRRTCKWRAYIAKVGSKWYPIESVTEQLLTRLGQIAGLRIADSQLRIVGRQVRFLSRYFLKATESLYHGFDLFKDHIGIEIVNQIAEARVEPEFYTFQTIREAVSSRFPEDFESIMRAFVEMIAFDALVGNNDRHPANWGIVVELMGAKAPRFSRVFDTARGLFWNYTEENINRTLVNKAKLEGYVRRSAPQTGWDNLGKVNHFDLVRRICESHPEYCDSLRKYVSADFLVTAQSVLEREFNPLMSQPRRALILQCLERRLSLLTEAVS